MVFVPSREGLSHVRDKWTEVSGLEAGFRVLLEAVNLLDDSGDLSLRPPEGLFT
jgi:hypothetical protein